MDLKILSEQVKNCGVPMRKNGIYFTKKRLFEKEPLGDILRVEFEYFYIEFYINEYKKRIDFWGYENKYHRQIIFGTNEFNEENQIKAILKFGSNYGISESID